MIRRLVAGIAFASLGLAGCVGDDFRLKPKHSPNSATVDVPKNLPAASVEAASRVDSLGRQVLAANRDLGIEPMFLTVGTPEGSAPEVGITHRGGSQLIVTEGLVKKCPTDAELAAVICAEMGKMATEANAVGRAPAYEPPYAPPVGSDTINGGGDPTFTRQAERAKWEQRNPRPPAARPEPQDPGELSKQLLSRAGYNPDGLLQVAPLLRQAEANPALEKLLSGPKR